MKKILSITLMMLAFAAGIGSTTRKLFEKYMEDERFNYVYQKSRVW